MIRHNPNNDHASKNELARSYYKTSEDIITIRYHLLNIIFLRVSILIIVTSQILIQHNPYKNQASFAQVIDPIYSHASYFGKSIGLNKRTVPINRTVSSKWHQRVVRYGTLKTQVRIVQIPNNSNLSLSTTDVFYSFAETLNYSLDFSSIFKSTRFFFKMSSLCVSLTYPCLIRCFGNYRETWTLSGVRMQSPHVKAGAPTDDKFCLG